MTIPHQGLGQGRLVPSSHKGSKFRYTIVRQFSRGDERIREDIPVPDSLGKEAFLVGSPAVQQRRCKGIREVIPVPDGLWKEAFLVGVFTSRGNMKGH